MTMENKDLYNRHKFRDIISSKTSTMYCSIGETHTYSDTLRFHCVTIHKTKSPLEESIIVHIKKTPMETAKYMVAPILGCAALPLLIGAIPVMIGVLAIDIALLKITEWTEGKEARKTLAWQFKEDLHKI